MSDMKYRKKETATVTSQKEIADGIFDLRVHSKGAVFCRPGQFAGLFPPSDSRLLLRPISICESDSQKEEIRFVYRIAGEGTKLISGLKEGDTIEILSVLGNGFPLEAATGKKVALMGGGIGIPPMLYTARVLKEIGAETASYLGYRNSQTFLFSEFEPFGKAYCATEDGSAGVKGNVMDALAQSGFEPDIIMACGPMPMLRAIKSYSAEKGITAYISLEERMACGVGACLGCVAKTTHKDDHSHVNNTRICTEGPVFDAIEVEI